MNPTAFVQAMLPHQEVYQRDGDGNKVSVPDGRGGRVDLLASHYSAHNGEYRLTITAGTKPGPTHRHPLVSRGVPNGGLARLLLAFIVTEAKPKNTRTIDLGATLTAFCHKIDVTPSGGHNGRTRYVIEQIQRLATCSINWEWDIITPGRKDLRGENLIVVKSYHFWNQTETQGREAAAGGSITLSQDFWDQVVDDVFPVDFRKLQLFRARPTAYDLYLWLTFRLERLQRAGTPTAVLNYDQLHAQLGSHYQTDDAGVLTKTGKKNFAYEVRRALKAIAKTWPALRYETPRGRIVLHNTGPDVERRGRRP